jgi:hypothetical protein
VPAERGGVDPAVAVGELHALGAGGRTARVVDGRRRVLVGLPWARFSVVVVQLAVGLGTQHELLLAVHRSEGVGQLGVDQQDRRARVLDDVADFLGHQPEVDRYQDPAPAGHAPERREEPGGVVRHDRHPLALRHPETVERGGLRPCPPAHLLIRERPPRLGRLVRLVDHAHPVRVHGHRTVEEVTNRECDLHGSSLPPVRPGRRPGPIGPDGLPPTAGCRR